MITVRTRCDHCNAASAEYLAGGQGLDAPFVGVVRGALAELGWLYRRGEDLCPDCRAKLAEALPEVLPHARPAPAFDGVTPSTTGGAFGAKERGTEGRDEKGGGS